MSASVWTMPLPPQPGGIQQFLPRAVPDGWTMKAWVEYLEERLRRIEQAVGAEADAVKARQVAEQYRAELELLRTESLRKPC